MVMTPRRSAPEAKPREEETSLERALRKGSRRLRQGVHDLVSDVPTCDDAKKAVEFRKLLLLWSV